MRRFESLRDRIEVLQGEICGPRVPILPGGPIEPLRHQLRLAASLVRLGFAAVAVAVARLRLLRGTIVRSTRVTRQLALVFVVLLKLLIH